jgi:hypothetical protein
LGNLAHLSGLQAVADAASNGSSASHVLHRGTETKADLAECGMTAEKWELVRRLRYGALLRLFRHRYGHVLPDDDAGRDDLWLLVSNTSLAASAPEKKMRHVIELWAPWMTPDEAAAYVEHVWGLDLYERTETGEAIGRRLGLTNAERFALKLWPFKPVDATDEELELQRKVRRRENRRSKLRAKGVRPREVYLAQMAAKPKPWVLAGVSRRTWCRRMALGDVPIIVGKAVHDLVPAPQVESQQGCHEVSGSRVGSKQRR